MPQFFVYLDYAGDRCQIRTLPLPALHAVLPYTRPPGRAWIGTSIAVEARTAAEAQWYARHSRGLDCPQPLNVCLVYTPARWGSRPLEECFGDDLHQARRRLKQITGKRAQAFNPLLIAQLRVGEPGTNSAQRLYPEWNWRTARLQPAFLQEERQRYQQEQQQEKQEKQARRERRQAMTKALEFDGARHAL